MKRFISVLLAVVFLLSSLSVLAFAREGKITSFDIYEGCTAPNDNLQTYLSRLHCSASCLPLEGIASVYQDGVKKIKISFDFLDDDGDGVATLRQDVVVTNNMDRNTENSSYSYAFVDRNKEYTLVFDFFYHVDGSSDFTDDAVFTFNGSSDKVSVDKTSSSQYFSVTVGPMKITSKVCSCPCHIIWWQAKNPIDFFRALWYSFVQIRIWERTKNPEHQCCECGEVHYGI